MATSTTVYFRTSSLKSETNRQSEGRLFSPVQREFSAGIHLSPCGSFQDAGWTAALRCKDATRRQPLRVTNGAYIWYSRGLMCAACCRAPHSRSPTVSMLAKLRKVLFSRSDGHVQHSSLGGKVHLRVSCCIVSKSQVSSLFLFPSPDKRLLLRFAQT